MRKGLDYIIIALKGAAMGAADVIPGVSGGTIAFISGIYEELINSIKSFDTHALRLLLGLKFGRFWKKVNGNFLFSLVAGIAFSIFSLAKVMTYLLEHHPVVTWAFFFGLIVASTVMISRDIKEWSWKSVTAFLAGAAAIVFISRATPATTPDTWWFVLLCGAVAVCAMILPGISGAFILLLMGKYRFMMEAVSNYHITTILIFVSGAVAGIISFSHLLSWLLNNYRNVTIALLSGILLGSLYKIWPWKEVLDWYADSHGALHPLLERNVLPAAYAQLSGGGSYLLGAIVAAAAGFALITVMERIGRTAAKKRIPNEQ
ncbi:MAG: DUF368 domain-containing protein [Rikenellaceae bacterium]|nr:DUF368 domain-containing protein [Rikenellaceae bacterium]